MQELVGQTLGQYQIVEQIGQGGMATVFKAHQPGLERWVAVKVLPPTYAADPHFRKHFLREARAIAQLEHPHILPVYDFGQQGPYIYLVMRYVEGSRSLADAMHRPLSFVQMLAYLDQVAAALDYAHGRAIIHRDVKPTNILLNQDWVFLADFGLARLMESTSLTSTDIASGTPAYMSPEQGSGAKIDARTDVYAVGVIVYEMLTGQIPHVAEAAQAIIYKRNHEPAPSVRTSRLDISPQIDQIVQTALSPNPDRRFQSTGAFVAALRQAIQESNAGQWLTTSTPTRWIEPVPALWPPPDPLPLPTYNGPLVAAPNEPVVPRNNPPWLSWVVGSLAALIAITLLTGGVTWLIIRLFNTAQPTDEVSIPTPFILTPTSPTPGVEALFADEFDGVGLDRSKWIFLMGGGQLQVYNSVLRLTSAGQTFPLIYPTANPFPNEGNFRVKFSMRYLNAADRGTGFRMGTTSTSYGATQNRAELVGERLVEIEHDADGWRIVVGQAWS